MTDERPRWERPRRRTDAADIVSCRLGDARAASVIMTFDCAYAYRDGDFDLVKAVVKTAEHTRAAMDKLAERLAKLVPAEQPDDRGFALVLDVARNPQFTRVLGDHGIRDTTEPVKIATGDVLDMRSADLVVGREALVNDLAVELARRHVSYGEVEGNVRPEQISEALEGATRRQATGVEGTFALTECSPQDDIMLTLGLGVLWAAFRSPRSKDADAMTFAKQDYGWIV